MKLREYRKTAEEKLAKNGSRFRLILAIVISGIFALPFVYILSYMEAIQTAVPDIGLFASFFALGICAVYTWLVVLPVYYGILYMAYQIHLKKSVELPDMFRGFLHGNYVKTVRRSTLPMVKLATLGLAFLITANATDSPIFLVLIEFVVWIVAFSPAFLHNYGSFAKLDDDLPFLMKKALKYEIFLFLWVILGALTVGILWIVYVIPEYSVMYFDYVENEWEL